MTRLSFMGKIKLAVCVIGLAGVMSFCAVGFLFLAAVLLKQGMTSGWLLIGMAFVSLIWVGAGIPTLRQEIADDEAKAKGGAK